MQQITKKGSNISFKKKFFSISYQLMKIVTFDHEFNCKFKLVDTSQEWIVRQLAEIATLTVNLVGISLFVVVCKKQKKIALCDQLIFYCVFFWQKSLLSWFYYYFFPELA